MPVLHRWTRRRAALVALPLLLATIPLVKAGASGPIENCRTASNASLHWQRVDLPISNPTGFAVDYIQPNRLLVSNAKEIYFSSNHGCSWVNAVSLTTLAEDAGYSSAISRIVDVAFNFSGAAVATISEGVGSEARPHVIRSPRGSKGTWTTADDGLPAVGEPRTLTAGIVGFVIGLAQFGTDLTGGGGLPGGIGGGTDPTGQVPAMVYRSADGGKWTAGATTADFGGARVVSLIAADRFSASEVYAVADGRLYYSHDNGGSFRRTPLSGTPTALATTFRSEIAAFGQGFAARSRNAGVSFSSIRTVPGALAAAWRTDGNYMVASQTKVYRTDGRTLEDVTPAKYVTGTPTLRSTFIGEDTWYLAVGRTLYRWFDKYKPAKQPPGIPTQRVSYPPKPGTITPARPVINLRPNGTRTIRYRLALPKNATPLDVYYLIDVSASMGSLIDDLKKNAKEIGVSLKAQGIDINEGIAAVGTAPNTDIGIAPDPPTDPTPRCNGPNNPPGCHNGDPYHQPVLYKQWAPVGQVDQKFFSAVNRLQEEYYLQPAPGCQDGTHPGRNGCDQHLEGQLLSYVQAITGKGVSDPRLNVPVLPGQDAGFRQDESTRRIIIMGTDARFSVPVGTPTRNGEPDFAGVAALLKANGVLALGLSLGSVAPLGSRADLEYLARATGALAPPGGVPCQYGDTGTRIPAGRPVVCDDTKNFSVAISKLLASLADYQNVALEPSRVSPVLRGVSVRGFQHVNVKAPFTTEFEATYSCVGVPTGSYTVGLSASLRGYQVAQTVATVTCGAAVVPPVTRPDPVPLPQTPPGNPPPPPAPLPAQPVTQVQSQVQTQVQVNPQVGAAAQQEEQLQLALAQAGLFTVDDDEKVTQQAMSRRDEERAAVAALASVLMASAIVGLAMMRRQRTQQAVRVTPVWARRR